MIFAIEELFFPEQQQGINNNDDSSCWIDGPMHWRCAEMRRMENGQAALGAGLYCQGGDTAPATVTHTFDWKCDCFWIPVLLIMLCANESGAPGVFQLLPGSQEPDPHNKIVQSQCRGRDQRVTLYCCSRQWRSSYPTTCYFHLLSGPFRSVFLQ